MDPRRTRSDASVLPEWRDVDGDGWPGLREAVGIALAFGARTVYIPTRDEHVRSMRIVAKRTLREY